MIALASNDKLGAALLAAGLPPVVETRVRRPYRGGYPFWGLADRPPRVPDPLPPTWAPGPSAKLLMDLGARDCRFPVGDDDGELQMFCGEEAHIRGEPYCEACNRRVLPRGAAINPKVLH